MKILFVGDPHAKVSNLEEMKALFDFILDLPNASDFDMLLLAGDLFNDHSVVRLEVAAFWRLYLTKTADKYKKVLVLVGNHDLVGTKQMETGLSAVELTAIDPRIQVVNNPLAIGKLGFLPYISDAEYFYHSAENLFKQGATDFLFCHQTFNGAKYDNGMYAPEGFDPNKVPQGKIIAGHIHTFQEFDKVLYPGTARWETRSDANQEKGIWELELTETSFSKKMIPTKGVVTSIVEAKIKEGDALPAVPSGCKFYVELIGTTEWIKKTKEHYRGSAAIKSTYTDTKNSSRKPLGAISLEEFATKHFDITVNKEALFEALKDL